MTRNIRGPLRLAAALTACTAVLAALGPAVQDIEAGKPCGTGS
ncbi:MULTISPECIES: hypothetical protein [unclassified Streptomyces]|nr:MULTISPECIES: hypothetical protein [unclassified Streptomyces]